jgi:hypothetical protein
MQRKAAEEDERYRKRINHFWDFVSMMKIMKVYMKKMKIRRDIRRQFGHSFENDDVELRIEEPLMNRFLDDVRLEDEAGVDPLLATSLSSDVVLYIEEPTARQREGDLPNFPTEAVTTKERDVFYSWEQVEQEDGTHYFYNTVTGESTWEDPREELMRQEKSSSREIEDWEANIDGDGRTFYYNMKTGESVWTLPDGLSERRSASNPEHLSVLDPLIWEVNLDADGRTFYYNLQTGESVWERPSTEEIATTPADVTASVTADDDSSIPKQSSKAKEVNIMEAPLVTTPELQETVIPPPVISVLQPVVIFGMDPPVRVTRKENHVEVKVVKFNSEVVTEPPAEVSKVPVVVEEDIPVQDMDDWEEVTDTNSKKLKNRTFWYCYKTNTSRRTRPRFIQDSYSRPEMLAYMRKKLKKKKVVKAPPPPPDDDAEEEEEEEEEEEDNEVDGLL